MPYRQTVDRRGLSILHRRLGVDESCRHIYGGARRQKGIKNGGRTNWPRDSKQPRGFVV